MKLRHVFLPLLTCVVLVLDAAMAKSPAGNAKPKAWAEDSRARGVVTATDAERKKWLNDDNPLLRAWALAYLNKATSAHIRTGLLDSWPEVREAALWRAIHDGVSDADELLKLVLDDPNPVFRAHATFALLKRGFLPPIQIIREVRKSGAFRLLFNHRDVDGGLYRNGSRNLEFEGDEFSKALVAAADEDVFAMLVEESFTREGTCSNVDLFAPVGRFIAAHPNALKLFTEGDKLLRSQRISRYSEKHESFRDSGPYAEGPGAFAIYATAAAGPAILPTIHPLLRDPSHLTRRIAAAVCGRIGDRSSLKPLLHAFENDDGLAMGAIATGLGQLGTPEALPALTTLYEKLLKEIHLSPLDYAEPVWLRDEELVRKYTVGGRRPVAENLPKGSNPVRHTTIIDAIEHIGVEHAQPFFRSLATKYVAVKRLIESESFRKEVSVGSGHYVPFEIQMPVARNLRPGTEAETAENTVVLLELLHDGYGGRSSAIAYAAAVSLLHFDLRDGEKIIRDELAEGSIGNSTHEKLQFLKTVPHTKRAFLDDRLRELMDSRNIGSFHREMIPKMLAP